MPGTISVVGAGRVGRTLARRLRELGWSVGAVVTRSKTSARLAVRAIGAGSPHGRPTRSILAADVVLLATPDDSLPSVAVELARIGGEEWRGKVVLHTSGALDRSVLAPLARCGANTGSLHPMQTFSRRAAPKLAGVTFAIEGERRAQRVAGNIARELEGVPVPIEAGHKPAYHAAAVMVASHSLAVVEAATQILMKIGFTRRRAVRALLPLMRQMLANFERLGPRLAWTGPVARGDFSILAAHIRALVICPPEFAAAYVALARLGVRVLADDPERTLRQLEQLVGKS